MNRIERIAHYEEILDRVKEAMKQLEEALDVCGDIGKDMKKLESYYTGKQWLKDFEADEKGLLPDDLKRGVLSEDGIDEVLEEYRELKQRMKKI